MMINYKQIQPTSAVTVRRTIQRRAEIQAELAELLEKIPSWQIAGAPFCSFNFITSVTDGYDVTLGFPTRAEIGRPGLHDTILPEMEVLSIIHRDEPQKIEETIGNVFSYAHQYGLISDEFYREVYFGESDPDGQATEIQFVIHNWNLKLSTSIERVLGVEARESVLRGSQILGIESSIDERFQWVRKMLERIDGIADTHQKWDIISSCAHVFPQGQISKLSTVFQESQSRTGDPLQAVDAVIRFMDADPGWAEGSTRNDYTIFASKKPRDPKAFAEAESDAERRQAYCYCPLVRTKMDQGMPIDFCNCGSGWFRQQWEGATGKPVKVEIVQSVLKGDDKCEFAIHLAKDM